MNVLDDSLEVGSGIIRPGDEDVIGIPRRCRGVEGGDRDEPEEITG